MYRHPCHTYFLLVVCTLSMIQENVLVIHKQHLRTAKNIQMCKDMLFEENNSLELKKQLSIPNVIFASPVSQPFKVRHSSFNAPPAAL